MALLGASFRIAFIATCVAALAASLPCAAIAAESMPLEDAVKAAYVYKFAPFVTWPAQQASSTAFTICSVGADPVSALLPQVTEGQRIDGRPIRIRALADGEAATDCAILYIAAPAEAGTVLEAVHGKPVLTVTSSLGPHGIIQLVTVAHHVGFDIDAKLAAEDGLSISSKLLGLARNVTRATETPP